MVQCNAVILMVCQFGNHMGLVRRNLTQTIFPYDTTYKWLQRMVLHLVLNTASYWSLSKYPFITFVALSLPKQIHCREVASVQIDIQSSNWSSFHMMPELQTTPTTSGWVKWLAEEVSIVPWLAWGWSLNKHILTYTCKQTKMNFKQNIMAEIATT